MRCHWGFSHLSNDAFINEDELGKRRRDVSAEKFVARQLILRDKENSSLGSSYRQKSRRCSISLDAGKQENIRSNKRSPIIGDNIQKINDSRK